MVQGLAGSGAPRARIQIVGGIFAAGCCLNQPDNEKAGEPLLPGKFFGAQDSFSAPRPLLGGRPLLAESFHSRNSRRIPWTVHIYLGLHRNESCSANST